MTSAGRDPGRPGAAPALTVTAYPYELDLAGSADGLAALAGLVAAGGGRLPCAGLDAVEVRSSSRPGVSLALDGLHRILVITGDRAGLAWLAENLADIADMTDGGHWHLDPYEGHAYLRAGSLPAVVNSPYGPMPARPACHPPDGPPER
ncbi:hypothetical protein AB0D08_25595 [Kitasatospora sp. NPDC048540]|uniref:Imm32 family immunity protein n=1 Tax=Kitasatospora sp. NPDC048540 TaxID=3155634 RepID=UPI0033D7E6B5